MVSLRPRWQKCVVLVLTSCTRAYPLSSRKRHIRTRGCASSVQLTNLHLNLSTHAPTHRLLPCSQAVGAVGGVCRSQARGGLHLWRYVPAAPTAPLPRCSLLPLCPPFKTCSATCVTLPRCARENVVCHNTPANHVGSHAASLFQTAERTLRSSPRTPSHATSVATASCTRSVQKSVSVQEARYTSPRSSLPAKPPNQPPSLPPSLSPILQRCLTSRVCYPPTTVA
jgi:hypothetical protein